MALVCAPAGYGKTTLLADLARRWQAQGSALVWYSLDPSDDDPATFSQYLVTGLSQALNHPPGMARIVHLLRTSPDVGLQAVLPDMLNAIADHPSALLMVLDDYHLIHTRSIHDAVGHLIERLPENAIIAIGSRTVPPLHLARLRARNRLSEIRTADLRFSPAETRRFLDESMQLTLPPAAAAELGDRTEGWAAGLQLAALALRSSPADMESAIGSFSGRHQYLVEYLLDEVINRLSEEVQTLLLHTAVLERLSAPLCDAVCRAAGFNLDSRPILEQLVTVNLFVVALDEEGTWFRHHHLFRDFLLAQLSNAMPERIPQLHRAACQWLEEHGSLREAARHAFATHDWDFAADFVERNAFALIIHGEITTMYEWCSAFPEAVMDHRPNLCILQCWGWVLSSSRQNRLKVERRLEQAGRGITRMTDPQAAEDLTQHAYVVRSYLLIIPDPAANPLETLEAAKVMLTNNPEDDPGRFSGLLTAGFAHLAMLDAPAARTALEDALQTAQQGGLYLGMIESTFHLAFLLYELGDLEAAIRLCQQTQHTMHDLDQHLPVAGCLDIALGVLFHEQNRLEEAGRHLERGLSSIPHSLNPYHMAMGCVGIYRLNMATGNEEQALAALDHMEAAWPDAAFISRAMRTAHRLTYAPISVTAAQPEFQGFSPLNDPPPGMGPLGASGLVTLANLAWLQTHIARGKPAAVRPRLEQMLNQAVSKRLPARIIELNLLLAQLEAVEHPAETTAIDRAITTAFEHRETGFVRIFDRGPRLRLLLENAAKRGCCTGEIQAILDEIRPARDPAMTGESSLPEALSQRELELLTLIARGASNSEIADQLVISVGTVKSHINHILGKLGVANRTAAVARARDLGLL